MLGFFPNAATSIGDDEIEGAQVDTNAPVMNGRISLDLVTHELISVSWDAATDNVGISNYQYSFNGAEYTNNGTARSVTQSGFAAQSSNTFMVRSVDQAGLLSAPLTTTITTLEAPKPVLPSYLPPPSAATRSYDWLRGAIVRWSHRDNLGDMLDDFIMLAEKRINGDLEARLQVAATTIRTTPKLDGVLLPFDIAEIKALAIPGYPPLEYLAPDNFDAHHLRREAGTPKYYTVFGPYLHMAPVPNAEYDLACAYRQKIPSLLDAAGGVNWLIREQPDIYLSACMLEVFDFTKNFAEQGTWEKKYALAVDALNGNDWNMAASLRIRTDTRTV